MSTKARVAEKVAEKTGMQRARAVEAVQAFVDSAKDALATDGKLAIVGFGAFTLKKRRGRQGRNPRTGETIEVPEKTVASFRPGKAFRQLVNGGMDDGEGDD